MQPLQNAVHPIARSFDRNSATYERARPSYPQGVVQLIAKHTGLNAAETTHCVLDLAAGTGKFTRQLAAQCGPMTRIEAVEPSAKMREQFATALPSVPVHDGTGDRIPFDDATFDVVTVAQAFHWFANTAALREIHRVLKPHGHLVLLWNLEDREVGWMGRLRDLYERYDANIPQYRLGQWRTAFDDPGAKELFQLEAKHHAHTTVASTATTIWERILSKSYITSCTENEQNALHKEVDAVLLEAFPSLATQPDVLVDAPFVTDVFFFSCRCK